MTYPRTKEVYILLEFFFYDYNYYTMHVYMRHHMHSA